MTEGEMRNSVVVNMYELLVFFLLPFILIGQLKQGCHIFHT